MADYVVGLTGGIGSGKTTITNLFIDYGITIVDADIVAREVVTPPSKALAEITAHFGADILFPNGQLERRKLRDIIFADQEEKNWLNHLLHPLIRAEIIKQLKQASSPYVILVAPLLLENNLQTYVNTILVIDVDESTQISRTCKRDKVSEAHVKQIIASQISRKERLTMADDIIDNQHLSMSEIKQQVAKLHEKYLNCQ